MSEVPSGVAENAIFNRLSSFSPYHPASARLFVTDWGLEPGDIVSVKSGEDTYSVPIYSMDLQWNGASMVDIQATGNREREPLPALRRKEYATNSSVYGYQKEQDTKFKEFETWRVETDEMLGQYAAQYAQDMDDIDGRILRAMTAIEQNANEISLRAYQADLDETNRLLGEYHAEFTISAYRIMSRVEDAEGNISRIQQTAHDIQVEMSSAVSDLYSHIFLSAEELRTEFNASDSQIYSVISQTAHDLQIEFGNATSDLYSHIFLSAEELRTEFNASDSQIYSVISQTAHDLQIEFGNTTSDLYSHIFLSAEELRTEFASSNSQIYSVISQTAHDLQIEFGNATSDLYSHIFLSAEELRTEFSASNSDIYSVIRQTAEDLNVEFGNAISGLYSNIHVSAEELRTEFRSSDSLIYSVIRQTKDDLNVEFGNAVSDMYSQIHVSAEELRTEFSASNSEIYSSIRQTASGLEIEFGNSISNLYSSITASAEALETEFHNSESTIYSTIRQTASGIQTEVHNTESRVYSAISQQADRIALVVDGNGNINAASIVAAINATDGSSLVAIDADHVYISGNTKLSGKLSIDQSGYLMVNGVALFPGNGTNRVVINNGTITASNVQVSQGGNLTFVGSGSGEYYQLNAARIPNFITALQLVAPTGTSNTYTLQKQTVGSPGWTDVGSFSRATSLTGGWSGGTYTVEATPQGNTEATTISSVAMNGVPKPGATEKHLNVPVKVMYQDGSDESATGFTGYIDVDAILAYTDGWNAAVAMVKPPSLGISDTIYVGVPSTTVGESTRIRLSLSKDPTPSATGNVWVNYGGTTVGRILIGDWYSAGYDAGVSGATVDVAVVKGNWVGGVINFTPSSGSGASASVALAQGTDSYSNGTITIPILDGGYSTDYAASLTVRRGEATPSTPVWDATNHQYTLSAGGSFSVGNSGTIFQTSAVETFTPTDAINYGMTLVGTRTATGLSDTITLAASQTGVSDHSAYVEYDDDSESQINVRVNAANVYDAGTTDGFTICHDSIGLSATSQTIAAGTSITIYPKAKATKTSSNASNITTQGITITASGGSGTQRTATGLSDTITLLSTQTGTSDHSAYVEYDDDSESTINVRIDASRVYAIGYSDGYEDGSTGVPVTVDSIVKNGNITYSTDKKTAYVPVLATASNGATGTETIECDVTASFNAGEQQGAAGVTLSVSGWTGPNGRNTVTASNGSSTVISLPSFTTSGGTTFNANHQTTVNFSTSSVTSGPLKSVTVDATSVYNAGYNAGAASAVQRTATGLADTITLSASDTGTSNHSEYVVYDDDSESSINVRVNASSVYDKGTTDGFTTCYDSIGLSTTSQTIAAGSSITIYPKAKSTKTSSSASNITSKGITITAASGSTTQRTATGLASTIMLTASETGASDHTVNVNYNDGSQSSISARVNASNVYAAGFNVCHDSITLSYSSGTLSPGESITIYPRAKASVSSSTITDITSRGITITAPSFSTVSMNRSITSNGTYTYTPSSGYDGISDITITVNVPTGGGGGGSGTYTGYIMSKFIKNTGAWNSSSGSATKADAPGDGPYSSYGYLGTIDTSKHGTGGYVNLRSSPNGSTLCTVPNGATVHCAKSPKVIYEYEWMPVQYTT